MFLLFKKKRHPFLMAMVVFSIFCLTKIIKTKLRKMRLEFRIIGSRMGGIWKPHKTFKKKGILCRDCTAPGKPDFHIRMCLPMWTFSIKYKIRERKAQGEKCSRWSRVGAHCPETKVTYVNLQHLFKNGCKLQWSSDVLAMKEFSKADLQYQQEQEM